ncbi:hypothetical protein EsH8_III_001014 [Colletotrichum jinshuiense]
MESQAQQILQGSGNIAGYPDTPSDFTMTSPPLPYLIWILWDLLPPPWVLWIYIGMKITYLGVWAAVEAMEVMIKIQLIHVCWRKEGNGFSRAVVLAGERFAAISRPST